MYYHLFLLSSYHVCIYKYKYKKWVNKWQCRRNERVKIVNSGVPYTIHYNNNYDNINIYPSNGRLYSTLVVRSQLLLTLVVPESGQTG